MKYSFEGKTYEIIIEDEWDRNKQRAQQVYDDFKYCELIYDWNTIKLRILNGKTLGWLKEI